MVVLFNDGRGVFIGEEEKEGELLSGAKEGEKGKNVQASR